MAEFQTIPLGEVCQVTPGPSGVLLDNLHDGPNGVPVVAPPDITDQGSINAKHVRRASVDRAEKLSRFRLREGDILYVRQGAIGRLALAGPQYTGWIYSSACLRIRPNKELVLPAYLAAFLSYEPTRSIVLEQALPGTVPSLNVSRFPEIPIVLPPLSQQQVIAETIGDIAANADIHRAIVDRLNVLRQAVFADMIQGRDSLWAP